MKGRKLNFGDYRYQYNGKELVEDMGLKWNDYGARWYDAVVGRFTGVDPIADDPEQIDKSPYAYTWNNPIRYTDPLGLKPEDDYGLDKDGNITLLRKTDDATDKLIVLDNEGNETDKTIEVEKGVLNNVKEGKTSNGTEFDYMKINSDETATNLFEFVADNSKVEWSQIKFGTKSNYLSTSHKKHSEPGGVKLMYDLTVGKYTVREHSHSHPTSTTGPSGYHPSHKKGQDADKRYANWISKYNPSVKLKVYEVKTSKYIDFK